MAKTKQKSHDRAIERVYLTLVLIAGVTLIAISGLSWWAHTFTTNMVRTELAEQKIFFPPKGSPALDPKEFPDLQKYAGQQVDNAEKARAYANGFIGRHLKKVADGKVYAEVSTEAMKDPSNQKLQQQKATLFQGETLRGMLLADGYGFGTIGEIAKIVAIVSFLAGVVMLLLGFNLWRHLSARRK